MALYSEDEPPAEEFGNKRGTEKKPRKEVILEDEEIHDLPIMEKSINNKSEKMPAVTKIIYFIATLCITFALIFKVLYNLNHP